MKIGVLAFISETSVDTMTIARKVESLGFDSFFLPEHPIIPVVCKSSYPATPDGSIPEALAHFIDPFIGLAQAAAVTSRIELGTGICLVPEHDPIILAKEIATLDLCSGGRFIFGIGAGWLAEESAIMGVDFKRRWPMTREYIRAMKELWTKAEASFDGRVRQVSRREVLSEARPQAASADPHWSDRERRRAGSRVARHGRDRRRLGASRAHSRSSRDRGRQAQENCASRPDATSTASKSRCTPQWSTATRDGCASNIGTPGRIG